VKPEVLDLWLRAQQAARTARQLTSSDPDASVSRAYYAAYYAVCALFASEGRTFTRHTAVETAVHRDLVRTGRWLADLGAAYSWLVAMRYTGDYGGGAHASADDAGAAIAKVDAILQAVRAGIAEALPD
jgi:uncharacterized protein (UPF0332 family)